MKPPLSGLVSSIWGGFKGCVSPYSSVCVHSQYWCVHSWLFVIGSACVSTGVHLTLKLSSLHNNLCLVCFFFPRKQATSQAPTHTIPYHVRERGSEGCRIPGNGRLPGGVRRTSFLSLFAYNLKTVCTLTHVPLHNNKLSHTSTKRNEIYAVRDLFSRRSNQHSGRLAPTARAVGAVRGRTKVAGKLLAVATTRYARRHRGERRDDVPGAGCGSRLRAGRGTA